MTPDPRPDVTALVDSLHALARHAHDDHTVATEAADLLVDLARRLTEQDAEIARLREVSARQHELLFAFHAATDPEQHQDICDSIGIEADWCEARFKALEAQLTAAEQALAAARRERDVYIEALHCASIDCSVIECEIDGDYCRDTTGGRVNELRQFILKTLAEKR